ncbi:hypothetical protein LAZ67_9000881 [Cordylochernes scorpioides]|uniref:Mos1 transposase HTH domain-containing protein n=1 Tax=Cordylochernes scorpioides TaxID=51811 RepID=A0ABY6KSR7_9ARAC|nr:hypothetical protein LAZ67_9000881 [Cordylochernes scorpioides]
MEQKLKQRICIEFCVKLQISATDTFEMLNKAFPNNAPKRTTVFEWHSRFKAGRISIEDDPRQGHPTFQRTDENVQKITDLIKENPRTTLLELEQDTGISKTTIGRIVTEDLRLKKTPAKFIPRFLTNEQKLCRLATCEDMLEMIRTDPEWKDKIIIGDETWVYGYDPETKRQSAEWRGQGKRFEKKRPEKWTNGDWILHHDNARPHTAHLVTSFLAKNWTEILPQPPYSPDIAPNDFFLFPKLKAVLKGRHFDTREDIIEKSLLALKSIPKEAYKNCFDNWEKRWRCHRNGGSTNLHQVLCEKRIQGCRNFWMLQTAYGDAVMSRRRVFEWYKRFKEGREETADNERSGRPSTSTTPEKVEKVLELVREDRRITVREVAEEAGISFGSTQLIIKDILGVRKLNAVLVPKDLTFDQKNARKETASLNLEATTDDPELLKRVITGDETWIYGFDSETTHQASEWRFKNEPRPKKARKAPNKVKVMLTVFFDFQGIVHHEFQQQGSTITADSYLGVLRRLREAIKQKRPEPWRSKSWILHHDNAPVHTALKISRFLQDHSTFVFPHPPTVPIWHPATSSFLESSKKILKGRKFQSIEEIKVDSKKAMKAIPKTDYQRWFADWKKRWLKCIAANRDYFEEDNLNLEAWEGSTSDVDLGEEREGCEEESFQHKVGLGAGRVLLQVTSARADCLHGVEVKTL